VATTAGVECFAVPVGGSGYLAGVVGPDLANQQVPAWEKPMTFIAVAASRDRGFWGILAWNIEIVIFVMRRGHGCV
jgi:hypothetical protein